MLNGIFLKTWYNWALTAETNNHSKVADEVPRKRLTFILKLALDLMEGIWAGSFGIFWQKTEILAILAKVFKNKQLIKK